MAQQPVAELWIQHRAAIVVQVPQAAPVVAVVRHEADDRQHFALATGVGLVALGLYVLGISHSLVLPLIGLAIGAALLMRRSREKRKLALPPAAQPALPSTPPEVLAERSRRAVAAMIALGEPTFEMLLAKLRWTEPVLLETLVALKQQGLVDEDLNLESGQWVYRAQSPEHITGGALTLDERKQRVGAKIG